MSHGGCGHDREHPRLPQGEGAAAAAGGPAGPGHRLGIDPGDILSTAMGQSGCDLYLSPAGRERFPFGVECKAQEAIALPAWWRQCTANAEAEGLAPLLVLKQSRREPLAVLRWSDLLALLSEVRSLREAALEQVAPDWRPPATIDLNGPPRYSRSTTDGREAAR